MSANPIYITQALSTVICCNASCGVAFGIPERLEQELRNSHKVFYCPHGHGQHFDAESALEKAERERKAAEWRAQVARDDAERNRQDKIALRLRYSNLKERIKRGKCAVKHCKERFPDVKEHLKKHKRFR